MRHVDKQDYTIGIFADHVGDGTAPKRVANRLSGILLSQLRGLPQCRE